MPKEVGGIYAVITTTVTKSEGKILQENRYLCFARYLGEHKWQLYDEIDLELNRLDETAEDVIPQEGIMVPIPDLFGKAGGDTDAQYREEVIAYCSLGTPEEIRKLE